MPKFTYNERVAIARWFVKNAKIKSKGNTQIEGYNINFVRFDGWRIIICVSGELKILQVIKHKSKKLAKNEGIVLELKEWVERGVK